MIVRRASILTEPKMPTRRTPRLSVIESRHYNKARRTKKRNTTAVVAAIALTISLLFVAWVRVSQLQSAYAISTFETEHTQLLEQKRLLELEMAVLKSPERIAQVASSKLSLVRPSQERVIRLEIK